MTPRDLDIPRDRNELLAILDAVGLDVDEVERDFLRRDGDRRAIVGIRFRRADTEGRGYLKFYGERERSLEVLEKWRSLRVRDGDFGPGLRALPDDRGLLYLLPNDAGLRDLPRALDLDKLKRLIEEAGLFPGLRVRGSRSRLRISRYKPEHRLVAFLDLALKDDGSGKKSRRSLVMRLFADRRARVIAALVDRLRDDGLDDVLPSQTGVLLNGRLQLEERLDGTELFDGRAVSPEEIGGLLDRFHASAPEGLRFVSALALVRERLAESRAGLGPEYRERLDDIAARLRALMPLRGRRGLVHGDLHPRQFIVSVDRLALIDLERCAISYPSIDRGHFLCELELFAREQVELAERARSLRETLEGHWLERSNADERVLLRVGMALGELAAATRFGRRLEATASPAEIDAALLRALRHLPEEAAGTSWLRLHPRGARDWPAFIRRDDGEEIGALRDRDAEVLWPLDPTDDEALPALAGALERGDLRGWRPGQRAVVATRDGARYLKILPPRRLPSRLALMTAILADEEARDLLPAVLGHDDETGIIELAALPGATLFDRLARGDENALPAAGGALARFHALDPTTRPELVGDDDVDLFLDHARRFRPDLAKALDAARETVPAALRCGDEGLIHNDMHDKNFLVDRETVRIIDFDGARSGPRARDLGNFCAHLELRRRQRDGDRMEVERRTASFLGGYTERRPLPLGVEVERRRSLFRLACVYLFRRPWEGMAIDLLRDLARGALLLLGMLALSACVAIVPEQDTFETAVGDWKARLGPAYIRKKDTIEIEGDFAAEAFLAERIEIEEEDDEIEIKSTIVGATVDALRIGPIDFVIGPESKLLDEDGRDFDRSRLPDLVGRFVKVEGIERDGVVLLRKLSLRERKEGERDRLQARVEDIDLGDRELLVGGIRVDYPRNVPVLWDVAGQAPPPPGERGLRPQDDPRLKKIVRVDDDDLRPGSGFQVTDWLNVGGEVQWDLEWRKNHNLRDERKRDRLVHEMSAKLELAFEIDEKLLAITQLRASRDFEIYDQSGRQDFGTRLSIEQAFVVALDFPFDGMALELGRQKFDHGREWVMDDDIDGARLFFNLEDVLLEFSVSQQLFDEDREEDGITNLLAAAHIEILDDSELFVYAMHRGGGRLVDLDRWHFGFSLELEFDQFSFFLDAGYVIGSEDDLEVEGWGVDAMALYVFEEHDWEPSIYIGLAFGSGDDDISDGKDSSFRQTGLNDNNDKLNGVTSFRYLGELVRPELSNIIVLTAGFGFRPYRNTSVDFLIHHYRQVEAFPRLRDTRLRLDPLGMNDQLGSELDLVIGLEAWRPLEIEIVFGWFRPGQAFEHGADEAWYITFQAEWNF